VTRSLNILIAHRSPLYRRGLELALADQRIACRSTQTEHFRDLTNHWLPASGFDLLLLDENLPGLSCLCKLKDLVEQHRAPILLCTERQDPVFVGRLKAAGVRGLLSATMHARDLRAALTQLRGGGAWIEPAIPAAPGPAAPSHPDVSSLRLLTATELRVLSSLGDGLANKQIADSLNLSVHTVKTHMSSIFRKLDVSNRTKLAMSLQQLRLSA
jgi:DNA-binding NarL/FixJ family response regulator